MLVSPLPANSEVPQMVRYVVTSDGGQEIEIHYQAEVPTENWSGVNYEHVWVGEDEPWERTVALANAAELAYVSVRVVGWNPNMHCEIWIGEQLKMQGDGVCIPAPSPVGPS